tara:strand:+ start:2097 stop:3716 length:1620 start_codon:yes stop_codon:yes gene_type:complete
MSTPIDIHRFPWIKALSVDYSSAYTRLAEFFPGNPADEETWVKALSNTKNFKRQRKQLVELLTVQQKRREAPKEALLATQKLKDKETVAVVTGQQAGLFGGPLYTLLKAITTIQLSRHLSNKFNIVAVPVFWIHSEDHDWNEIRTFQLLNSEFELKKISLSDRPGDSDRAAGSIILGKETSEALSALEKALPVTEFTENLIANLKKAYRQEATMGEAFGRLLENILGRRGLVVYDSSDPASKPLVAKIFTDEIKNAGQTNYLVKEAGKLLEAKGYHSQATPTEGNLALFFLDKKRLQIRHKKGDYFFGDKKETLKSLSELARQQPELFSPNVLLRPIVQDAIFPTVCYVAGPGELAYLAQLGSTYKSFEVPMPVIYQRASATLIDANTRRFIDRYKIPIEQLQADDEKALNNLIANLLPVSVENTFQETTDSINHSFETLTRNLSVIDSTLEGASHSTLKRIQDNLNKLRGKTTQASKRKNEVLHRQFLHAKNQIFPGGKPQERNLGFIYFLNRYGPSLIDRLNEALTLDTEKHWILTP